MLSNRQGKSIVSQLDRIDLPMEITRIQKPEKVGRKF
jgi:hypothetical protein